MSNLDTKLRTSGRAEILRIHERPQATILYVRHDQVESMAMADRIVVMRSGGVVQIGSPLDVYNHPVDVFVGQFIGSPPMSICPAYSPSAAASVSSRSVATTFRFLPADRRLRRSVETVAVGLRSAALRLDPNGSFVASVEFTERLDA